MRFHLQVDQACTSFYSSSNRSTESIPCRIPYCGCHLCSGIFLSSFSFSSVSISLSLYSLIYVHFISHSILSSSIWCLLFWHSCLLPNPSLLIILDEFIFNILQNLNLFHWFLLHTFTIMIIFIRTSQFRIFHILFERWINIIVNIIFISLQRIHTNKNSSCMISLYIADCLFSAIDLKQTINSFITNWLALSSPCGYLLQGIQIQSISRFEGNRTHKKSSSSVLCAFHWSIFFDGSSFLDCVWQTLYIESVLYSQNTVFVSCFWLWIDGEETWRFISTLLLLVLWSSLSIVPLLYKSLFPTSIHRFPTMSPSLLFIKKSNSEKISISLDIQVLVLISSSSS